MITSASNAQVKRMIAYRQKAKARRQDGVFVIEGWKEVREAPPALLIKIYVAARADLESAEAIRANAGCALEIVSDDVFDRISDTKTPQGIAALVRQPVYTCADMLRCQTPLLLLLEDIQDPGNVGTILRSAEAAGVTGVFLSGGCADIFSPKTVRATMGAVFRVPFLYTEHLRDTMAALSEKDILLFAAVAHGRNAYEQPDYTVPCAFVIGNEGQGLSPETIAACTRTVTIPMKGTVESLNAAVSTALLIFEAAGQRRRQGQK